MNIQIFKKYLGVALLLMTPLASGMVCAQSNTEECASSSLLTEKGVSQELAVLRAKEISNVAYRLKLSLPGDKKFLVPGKVVISFDYHPQATSDSLFLDFQGRQLAPSCLVNGINRYLIADKKVDGHLIDYWHWHDEHVAIPRSWLAEGKNTIEVEFFCGDSPLNRHDDYLYTLFVPDHARAAFPCFDQPDLKARFSLELTLPSDWKAISSGSILKDSLLDDGEKRMLTFAETKPLPTYLFSFTAGKFYEKTVERDGHTLSCLYRETDSAKVDQLDEVMDEVALSLRWMENYTGIKYPFEKYGFVMIPSYQFGGMEHPGAIQFNDRTVFLGKNPTLDDRLHRLELLAHETAHMWFGDMVTMRWFNDVWTKEVFANYLASKVAREQFPHINHDLNFLKSYQIAALSTDRTEGTHPIQQPLENLNLAGLLYGNIIYDKSPVMMRKLEQQMGSDAFRKGLQTYLHTYAYGNATWDGLIDILDKTNPDAHLKQFSEVWVKQKGMPTITMQEKGDQIIIRQHDEYGRGIFWPQSFQIGTQIKGRLYVENVNMQDSVVTLSKRAIMKRWKIYPVNLIPNIDGKGYGRFVFHTIPRWSSLPDINRLAVLMTLYENYWMGNVNAEALFSSMYHGLAKEKNPLVASACSGYLSTIVRNMDADKRLVCEKQLFDLSRKHAMPAVRQLLLKRLYGTAHSPEVVDSLYAIWKGQTNHLLNERDYMAMAYHLAIMRPQQWQQIVDEQLNRLTSEDRKSEFQFVSRACNPDVAVQDALFEELKQKENRRTEPWASALLALLNDETREPRNNKYVLPGLDMLQEVQRTGDIFFPGYWVNALLGEHRSQEAKTIVENFVKSHLDYPQKLKNKLMEAAFSLGVK